MDYRFVGRHPETLGDGRTVAPGETVDIDPNDPVNNLLVEAGRLVQVGATGGRRRQGNNDEEARA